MEKLSGGEAPIHVMVLPLPIQGHLNPMLQFAKRLAFKGARVTLVTTSKSTPPSPSAVNFQHIEFPEGETTTTTLDESLELYETVVPQRLARLIEESTASYSVIVYDSILPWVLNIAKRFGLQAASFFTQSWSVNAIFYHLNLGTFKLPLLQQPLFSLPSMLQLDLCDLPTFICDDDDMGSYPQVSRIVKNQFVNFHQVDWILCNNFDELEHEIMDWMSKQRRITNVGPTIPSMYLDKRVKDDDDYGIHLFKPERDLSMKWLDSKEDNSVVYISFGSLAGLTGEQMLELGSGLKRSNRYFLWVVRKTQQSKLPINFIEETSEKGLVVSWSHQLDVLAHRAVGCFLTHCGWNSTLEALSLGLPMIAMPQWSDQPTNAKLVTHLWKVGVRVSRDEEGIVRKEEIERCISEIMEGEKSRDVKANSEKWKKLAKEAVDEGGSSDKNIDDFLAKLSLF